MQFDSSSGTVTTETATLAAEGTAKSNSTTNRRLSASVGYVVDTFTLDLTANTTSITQFPKAVMVGQGVQLAASIFPTLTMTNPTWTVGDNTNVFQDYTQTQAEGKVTYPGVTDWNKLTATTFYFENGSTTGKEETVTFAATVNGINVTSTGKIKVYKPTVNSFTGTWTTIDPKIDVRNDSLTIGDHPIDAGIYWDASVTAPATPASAGEIAFVQMINFTRKWQPHNSTTWWGYTSQNALDGGLTIQTQYGGQITSIGAGATVSHSSDDSPVSGLTDPYEFHSSNDSFKLYLMYRPANGRWVSLKRLNWSWMGTASLLNGTWSNSGGTWFNADGTWTTTSSGNTLINGTDDSTQPVWTDNFEAVKSRGLVAIP